MRLYCLKGGGGAAGPAQLRNNRNNFWLTSFLPLMMILYKNKYKREESLLKSYFVVEKQVCYTVENKHIDFRKKLLTF
jgi:hypothetical protein